MGGRPRVALVLGAGGPVGFAFHAGVLSAFAAAGWAADDADLIVGTSIGAVVGGLLRAGMVPDDLLARGLGEPLSEPGEALVRRGGGWPSLATVMAGHDGRSPLSLPLRPPSAPSLLLHLARDPRRIRPGLLLAGLLPTGDVDPSPIAAAFDAVLGGGWPTRDLWVCATDLDRGARVVFGAPGGPATTVGLAVAASSSVPSVFAPVVVDGRRYVDGGAHSPANTDLLAAVADDLAAVVVSFPMGIGAWPGRGGADLPGRWVNHTEAWRGLGTLRRAGVAVLLVEPGPGELEVMGYDAFDLSHRPEIAVRARDATAARLKEPHPVRAILGLA